MLACQRHPHRPKDASLGAPENSENCNVYVMYTVFIVYINILYVYLYFLIVLDMSVKDTCVELWIYDVII